MCELFKVLTRFVLGNGSKISFWKDKWVLEVPLCRLFPRLFAQSRQKSSVVADMGKFSQPGSFVWSLIFYQSSQQLVSSDFESLSSLLQ